MIVVDGTLKRRLGVWLFATVGILGLLLMLEAYTSARRAANSAYDSQLEAASLTIAEAIQWQDGHPLVSIPAAAFQILATDQQEPGVLLHSGLPGPGSDRQPGRRHHL